MWMDLLIFRGALCCTHNNDRVKTARIAAIRDYVGIERITTESTWHEQNAARYSRTVRARFENGLSVMITFVA